MPTNPIYNTARWKALRKQVIKDEPVCHWCKKAPSTQADHLIELARGGDPYARENLVGSCRPCNAARGARFQGKRKAATASKAGRVFLIDSTGTPPAHFPDLSGRPQNRPESTINAPPVYEPGQIPPRLSTAAYGGETWGPIVAAWASRNLSLDLWPWQVDVLTAALEHDAGVLRHRWSLVSTARQNGKSKMIAALIGWWLTEGRIVRGGPQSVLSTAHKLSTAEEIAFSLFPILDAAGWSTWESAGRMMARHDDGSVWRIQGATPKAGHGTSNDLVIVDELFDVSEMVLNAGLLPTQRARPHPFTMMMSTAGTEESTAFIRWRERALAQVESGEPGRLHFAEWSIPPGVDPDDSKYWHLANPSIGLGHLTEQDIEDARQGPDRDSWLRSDLNLWTSARQSWLPFGLWESLAEPDPIPAGGFLAVDSDLTDNRYVGVRAARRPDGRIGVAVAFVVESSERLWEEIRVALDEPSVQLAITPGLAEWTPTDLRRRMIIVGQAEMYRYTALVRNMILERQVVHAGQLTLAEHVGRAVAGSSAQQLTLSSQKSPGPIELARCMVWAVGLSGRPAAAVTRPAVARSR